MEQGGLLVIVSPAPLGSWQVPRFVGPSMLAFFFMPLVQRRGMPTRFAPLWPTVLLLVRVNLIAPSSARRTAWRCQFSCRCTGAHPAAKTHRAMAVAATTTAAARLPSRLTICTGWAHFSHVPNFLTRRALHLTHEIPQRLVCGAFSRNPSGCRGSGGLVAVSP